MQREIESHYSNNNINNKCGINNSNNNNLSIMTTIMAEGVVVVRMVRRSTTITGDELPSEVLMTMVVNMSMLDRRQQSGSTTIVGPIMRLDL